MLEDAFPKCMKNGFRAERLELRVVVSPPANFTADMVVLDKELANTIKLKRDPSK